MRAPLLASLSILLSAGCGDGSSTGSPDLAAAPDLSPACGVAPIVGPQVSNHTPECVACVEDKCCMQRLACSQNSECVAARQCMEKCPSDDAVCTTACYDGHPMGQVAGDDFVSCRNTSCYDACANFACLGKVAWPQPTRQDYTLHLQVYEYQSGQNLPMLTVKVCAHADAACASPLQTKTTDSNGGVTLTAPAKEGGLGAYFEITGKDVVPTLNYLYIAGRPDLHGGDFYAPILSTSTWSLLTGFVKVTPDAARGHVLFNTKQCSSVGSAGVQVTASTADAQSKTVYMAGSLPSSTATQTDPSGAGAIVNLPAGAAKISSTLVSGTKRIGEVDVTVRAGAMTTINLLPTP